MTLRDRKPPKWTPRETGENRTEPQNKADLAQVVTEAEGGATGIGLLGKVSVHLVLTDLGMPDVTGWDVARAVRLQTPKLPVVVIEELTRQAE